jgi:hypothetical protein
VKTVLQIASLLPHKIRKILTLADGQSDSATCGLRAVRSPDQRPPPRPEPAQKCQIATSATANFTSADGGRQVRVNGAGSSGGAQHGHLSDHQCDGGTGAECCLDDGIRPTASIANRYTSDGTHPTYFGYLAAVPGVNLALFVWDVTS